MFYLTSKFHDNRVNTFGFMEGGGGGGAFEALPPGPGTPKKPRRNGVNSFFVICCCSLFLLFVGLEPAQKVLKIMHLFISN